MAVEKRFVADEIVLSIADAQKRDLTSGYTFEIKVVRQDTNAVTDTIAATAGGAGGSTITANRRTLPAAFPVAAMHTWHVEATVAGTGEVETIGVGYVEIIARPGT